MQSHTFARAGAHIQFLANVALQSKCQHSWSDAFVEGRSRANLLGALFSFLRKHTFRLTHIHAEMN